jgi:1,4-alpha-glucan branching enzyme
MLKQASRELLLAQASDWPFILRAGTSPDYARKRVKDHVLRFTRIYERLTAGQLDEDWKSFLVNKQPPRMLFSAGAAERKHRSLRLSAL